MTKLTIETDDMWTRGKIKLAIEIEIDVLRKAQDRIKQKITEFEGKYGRMDRDKLYGKIDDMEMVEWEGEIETLQRVKNRLHSLEEITFEYK